MRAPWVADPLMSGEFAFVFPVSTHAQKAFPTE
jgi:hypothetical protein